MHLKIPSDSVSSTWASEEFAALNCKDVRRQRRFERVASDFLKQPGSSVPDASGDWAGTKACYRLFDHEDVSAQRILDAHRHATLKRLQADEDDGFILVVQDTTALNFSARHQLEGLGPTSSLGARKTPGLFLHGHLVVDESSKVHGMLGAGIYARKGREDDPSGNRNRIALEQKESQRWLDGWHKAQQLWQDLGGRRRVLSVADREADIYELLAACQQQHEAHGSGAGLLIRSQHNRQLEGVGEGRMWQSPEKLTAIADMESALPRGKQGLGTRTAKLKVRAGAVELAVPANKRKYLGLESSIRLWALEIHEPNPPKNMTGVCWRLLTTEPILTVGDARRLAACYSMRWRIEMLFRIIKSGCKVEARQVQSVEKLKSFIALDLVVACRLLAMTLQARANPQEPAGHWLSRDEWEALCVRSSGGGKPPDHCPSIKDAVLMIAKLGGFLGRKGDGEPGSEVLWRGIAKLKIYAEAWQIFRQLNCG